MKRARREPKQGTRSWTRKVFTAVGVVMCVVLTPLLAMNLTLVVKGLFSDDVPDVGGIMPLVVLTDSMYPQIASGDLIFCHTCDAAEVAVGDVIVFFDPAGNGTTVTVHRVTEVGSQDGGTVWHTKGDANNVEDAALVTEEDLVACYEGHRIAGAGTVVMAMQTPLGVCLCVGVPFAALVAWDLLRRRINERRQAERVDGRKRTEKSDERSRLESLRDIEEELDSLQMQIEFPPVHERVTRREQGTGRILREAHPA